MTLNTYELTSICKNVDTHFSNNLYSQVSFRQVHSRSFYWRRFCAKLLLYYYLYYCVVLLCKSCKTITINVMLLYFDLLYYICCDSWHDVIHPRTFPPFWFWGVTEGFPIPLTHQSSKCWQPALPNASDPLLAKLKRPHNIWTPVEHSLKPNKTDNPEHYNNIPHSNPGVQRQILRQDLNTNHFPRHLQNPI